jgi:catechol 2,3-dioxygenase-like lactoylglutathione lyase family enzyme
MSDMRVEVIVIPVTDVDRAKRFYGNLGWRLDADFAAGDAFRVVQLTPPGPRELRGRLAAISSYPTL